ncbi:HPF/RaiA family ribosome-associated protein [Hydrogenophaga sp. 5NK40-0174]|uniref:HPF/RaiA family ribosome-associated protein n=1 Tax=Hydrogenophaga sp. 5NK40-0174 TaxID=3127649 RepID=UPI003108E881
MQVRIESRSPQQSEQWRTHVEQRVRFALRRLRGQVQRVHVRLDDINGPRGGRDMRCQVSVLTDGHGTLVGQATRLSFGPALEAALKRVTDSLVKQWQKQKRYGRETLRLSFDDAAPA